MTTGSTKIDRTVVTPSASGPGLVGSLREKTWSGTDYPKEKPTYSTYLVPKSRREYSVVAGKRVFSYVQAYKLRRIRNKPPKRVRSIDHPYHMSSRDVNYQIWQQRNNPYQSYTPNRYGWDTYMLPVQNPWDSNDDLVLLSRLRAKVAGSGFNAGVFLGEGREALNMITDAATRIYWGYRAAKRGDFRSARRYLIDKTDRSRKTFLGNREVANNWLELQYGWLPLLNDAKEGAEFLAHQLFYPLQTQARASYLKGHKVVMLNPGTVPIQSYSYTRKSIKATFQEKDIAQLSGLTDPLSVAWELIPYSFVIDWFIPISSYLSARGLASSMVNGTFVTSTKTFAEFNGLKGNPNSWTGNAEALSPCELVSDRQVTFTRSVSTALSVPPPKPVGLGSVPSWKRAANAVSLLVSANFR